MDTEVGNGKKGKKKKRERGLILCFSNAYKM